MIKIFLTKEILNCHFVLTGPIRRSVMFYISHPTLNSPEISALNPTNGLCILNFLVKI